MDEKELVLQTERDDPGLAYMIRTRGDYRAFVGDPADFAEAGVRQFELLKYLGLRPDDAVLDVGCGSLRAGRLLIPYLDSGKYFGIEPERWLVEEGLKFELKEEVVADKKPAFLFNSDFSADGLHIRFDFVLAHSIFTHACVRQIDQFFGNLRHFLAPGAAIVATIMPGGRNYGGDRWSYPGFVCYRPEFIQDIARSHGFDGNSLPWPESREQSWFVFNYRRP